MSKRTCLDCKYWRFYGGDPGFSSLTPGSDTRIDCAKGKWRLVNLEGENEDSFRSAVAKAETCKQFARFTEVKNV